MPNGGSDCCGTCWFNRRNQGEAGYGHVDDVEPNHCTIRDLAIENAFWTYCGNHPHHRPQQDPIPLGPVVVRGEGSSGGHYPRVVWQPSPDTEEIRQHLLTLLAEVAELPEGDDYDGLYLTRLVVVQLGKFREPRAVPGLTRVTNFVAIAEDEYEHASQQSVIEAARTALSRIGADGGLA